MLRPDGHGNQIEAGYLSGQSAARVREIKLPNGDRHLIMEVEGEIAKIPLAPAEIKHAS